MPYICHIHSGLYENDPDIEGCQNEYCLRLKELDVPKVIFFGSVPGGASKGALMKVKEAKFGKDMDKYREARREGLMPDQVTTEAVEAADKEAQEEAA